MSETNCLPMAVPVTPANRNERICELFGDMWLADYMDGALAFESLSQEQRAVASALDGVLVGMLDSNLPDPSGRIMRSFQVYDALQNDGWVDLNEWNALLDNAEIRKEGGFLSSDTVPFTTLETQMGAENAQALRALTSGMISSIVDEENGVRYQQDEIKSFLSPRAMGLVEAANQTSMASLMGGENALQNALLSMEGLCASIETKDMCFAYADAALAECEAGVKPAPHALTAPQHER